MPGMEMFSISSRALSRGAVSVIKTGKGRLQGASLVSAFSYNRFFQTRTARTIRRPDSGPELISLGPMVVQSSGVSVQTCSVTMSLPVGAVTQTSYGVTAKTSLTWYVYS